MERGNPDRRLAGQVARRDIFTSSERPVRLHVLLPGKLRQVSCRELFDDYAARCRVHGSTLALDPVRQQPERDDSPRAAAEALAREAAALLTRVPSGARIVALDERGEQPTSRALAERLRRWRDGGTADIAFLVGSARGLGAEALAKADWRLSLSRLTLPHELAVALLAEQLYRALTILAGHPYHRD
jgi:23S rRNA (pseudouridine1915-N3)-methyltransferase